MSLFKNILNLLKEAKEEIEYWHKDYLTYDKENGWKRVHIKINQMLQRLSKPYVLIEQGDLDLVLGYLEELSESCWRWKENTIDQNELTELENLFSKLKRLRDENNTI